MLKIYVAGAYSANDILTVLDNMRRGMRAATEVLLAGYSPFVPFFDYHFQLMLREGETLTVEDYYRYSIAWLPVCDAMLVLSGSEYSKGTIQEIIVAKELGIPIYYSLEELTANVTPELHQANDNTFKKEITNGKETKETQKEKEERQEEKDNRPSKLL